jgi:DNA (cytosine-5)-methyltransferase 1
MDGKVSEPFKKGRKISVLSAGSMFIGCFANLRLEGTVPVMPHTKSTAIDLFCGCGGMSWGLQSGGYDVRLGVDINKKYIPSFEKNFGSERTWLVDLNEVSGSDLLNKSGLGKGELDILVGGPPCQGFSKNVPRKYRHIDSDNNKLVKTFLRICEETSPSKVVMENVAEMRNGFESVYANEVIERLSDLGYHVIHDVFNAADYGIPQRRKRAFFLASKVKKPVHPKPTHSNAERDLNSLFRLKPWVTVWEAIGDLPNLTHTDRPAEIAYRSEPFSEFQQIMRGNGKKVTNHIARTLAAIQHERLSSIGPGQSHADLPPHLQVKGGYSGVYGRLSKEMVAPTITRWVFHPGGGRWGHPEDIRTITPRETARLQSFSDDFEFVGSYNDICGQLGNAVPPLLMEAILRAFH